MSVVDEEQEKATRGVFDYTGALAINAARMNHVATYGLSFAGKTVLDVGSGVGHLAQFFVRQGADVQCVDGRQENIDQIKQRYPNVKTAVGDAQDPLDHLGRFDVVFCYGLLYHVENPFQVIRNLAAVCKETLLLETCVSDHSGAVVNFVPETDAANQALLGIGCRPSVGFVEMALRAAGFAYVETPQKQPEYEDFVWTARDDGSDWRDNHNLRRVFIARREMPSEG